MTAQHTLPHTADDRARECLQCQEQPETLAEKIKQTCGADQTIRASVAEHAFVEFSKEVA